MHLGVARVFCLLAKSLECGAGKVGAREADGGERRKSELGKVDVVEADDAEILGHTQTFHVGGAQDANGGHIV